jgi:DNA-binding transcriptional ArsR family regulator
MATTANAPSPDPDDERYVFHTADALKALGDPLRLRFLILLADGPSTVKEAAEALGVPPTRLYYHVKILERHGLIHVAGRRLVSGIEERTYRARAKNWTMAPSLAASAISTSGTLRAVMNMVRAELEAVLQERPDEPIASDASSPLPAVGLTQLALGPEELPEVERRIASLMDDFGAPISDDAPGKQLYRMFFAVYQTPHFSSPTEED